MSWNQRQSHLGCKQSLTARSYNVSVNHRRQIIHSTRGFPSRWNDKTAVKFDQFVNDIRDGKSCQNNTFVLFERNEDGSIKEVMHLGAWISCDNGYVK